MAAAFSLLAALFVCLPVSGLLLCLAGVQVACHKYAQHKFASRLGPCLCRGRQWVGQHAAPVNAIGLNAQAAI